MRSARKTGTANGGEGAAVICASPAVATPRLRSSVPTAKAGGAGWFAACESVSVLIAVELLHAAVWQHPCPEDDP
jgi:hypothetical protein